MRIVVAGLAATYPLGGVFWDYLQYCQGLTDLGHEVLYLEDTGSWFFDPATQTRVESGAAAAGWLGGEIDRNLPALRDAWFVRDARGGTYGATETTVRQFCRDAELFLNISGVSDLRLDTLPRAISVYIDTDPMFSQRNIPRALAGELDPDERIQHERMLGHHRTFSYGENIGQPDCLVPVDLFDWLPTRQPVLIETIARHHVPAGERTRHLTTIGSWDPYVKPLEVAGRTYSGKQAELARFRELPHKSLLPFTLAMAGADPPSDMGAHGWSCVDPTPISASAERYVRFLAESFAEWSVAKNAYVASRSGWFSGRTALYLSLGVPAVVQDTGFSRFLPTGAGLHAFSTEAEALAAIEDIATNYERNCSAGLEIAREYFDSGRVLSRLIDDVFSTSQDRSRATT
jgi:hypothetical protein